MKKSLLMLALLTGFFIRTLSQPVIPVLTDWNTNPIAGESFGYNYFNPSGFAVGSAGSQVTWNFSGLGSFGHFVQECVTAGSTGLSSIFPNANIALTDASNNYSFFDVGASGQTYYGKAVSSSYNNYSDGEDYLRLPLTFTNTYTDSFHSFNNGIYRRGKLSVTADGYGTLIFPSGTFQKVLRVHFQERLIDSTTVVILDQNTDFYKWYIPWIHSPALIYGYVSSGSSPNYFAYYLDAPSAVLGLQQPTFYATNLQLFPNPAAGNLHISYYQETTQNTLLHLYNLLGTVVKEWNFYYEWGDIKHELDVTEISTGAYFLQINKGQKIKLLVD